MVIVFRSCLLLFLVCGHVVAAESHDSAQPRRTQVLLGGETFLLDGHHAFIMKPSESNQVDAKAGKPWIFYAPTLDQYPDKAESWMHQQFLDAGVAVAGIDVGEAYGSPQSLSHFDKLYEAMIQRGYSRKPALFGRSRGGLWVLRFAIEHPERVAGIGGIYPAYDYTTYPGVEKAASAYKVTADELLRDQPKHNPIKRAEVLARTEIPVFIIHGSDDVVVPIAENALALKAIYENQAQADHFTLLQIPGQGHSFWDGYFHCQPLVDFLIAAAKS